MNINQAEKSSNVEAWFLNINDLLLTLRFYGPMAKAWLVNINNPTTILAMALHIRILNFTSGGGAYACRGTLTNRRGAWCGRGQNPSSDFFWRRRAARDGWAWQRSVWTRLKTLFSWIKIRAVFRVTDDNGVWQCNPHDVMRVPSSLTPRAMN